jgi:hypothetical protein
MIKNSNTKWIIVVLIWAGALVLSYFNVRQIGETKRIVVNNDILQRDDQFWRENSENISKILQENARYFKPVISPELGFLTTESDLRELASTLGLREVEIIDYPDRATGEGMAVGISFIGSIENAVKCLDILHKEYPYLPVAKMSLSAGLTAQDTKFDLSLSYRYRLCDSENSI